MERNRGLAQWRMALRAVRWSLNRHGAIDLLRRRDGSVAGRVTGLASGPLRVGLEPFRLGAEYLDLTGLEPSQLDKFLVSGWLAIHDKSFTRAAASNAMGKRPMTR
jgi:hypothetical protein